MERGEPPLPGSRRRSCWLVLGAAAALLLVLIVALGLTLRRNARTLEATFVERCEAFKGYDCERIWGVFEQAYVGRDPCEVHIEAYDALIAAAPFKLECNRMMFWSKTKDLAHDFTEKNHCFLTVEETLLGSVLDGLTWCGKEGSQETFTTGCPGWTDCENNPVRSFWNRVSTSFADAACGDVSAMLSRDITTPFHPASVFASIEVKQLHSPRVKSLTVLMVTQKNPVTNCTNASLKDLRKELDPGIRYDCKEVSEAQLIDCSKPGRPCGSCW